MKKFFNLQRFDSFNKIEIGTGISNTLVSGTSKADSINNAGAIITIEAGAGGDYIYNTGQIVKIYGEGGNDTINNYNGKNVTIVAGEGDDSVSNNSNDGIIISLGDGNDYIDNWYGNKVSISGGAGNDYIANVSYSNHDNGKNVTISGGKGNDTINLCSWTYGYNANYTPKNNVIQYTEGDGIDVIYGFNSTDTLYVTGNSMSTMTSDNDFFVLFDSGSIAIKDAASQIKAQNIVTLSGGDSSLPTGLSINAKGTVMTASKKFKGSAIDLTAYEKIKTLNSSAVTNSLKITGNGLANIIKGGSKNDTIYGGDGNDSILGNAGNDSLFGDSGNDTLIGGNGNDTLTGDGGKDVFVHSKGADVITDYTEGADTVKLNSALKSVKVSGKNVILTTEGGSVTIQNGKDKDITLITKISTSSTSALLAEDNFMTSDNLITIVKNDLSATDYKIEMQNFETLTVENDVITFAGNSSNRK